MLKLIRIIFLTILISSCGQNEMKQKDMELKERELALKEKEFNLKQQDTVGNQSLFSSPTPEEISNSFKRDIPIPQVALVSASNVLPSWSQHEDIEGNYPFLTGLYVGALGKKPFKLIIESVDTINKTLSGYSKTSTSQTAFTGTYTMTFREPNSKLANNVIDFQTWIFKTELFEPSGINHTGVFQISFNVTDAHGSDATGTWTSYDGQLYRGIRLMDTYIAQEQ